jgi:hypothetical protein
MMNRTWFGGRGGIIIIIIVVVFTLSAQASQWATRANTASQME